MLLKHKIDGICLRLTIQDTAKRHFYTQEAKYYRHYVDTLFSRTQSCFCLTNLSDGHLPIPVVKIAAVERFTSDKFMASLKLNCTYMLSLKLNCQFKFLQYNPHIYTSRLISTQNSKSCRVREITQHHLRYTL